MASGTGEDERSLNRRLDSLRRERDSVRRLLEQAALNGVAESIDRLGKRLTDWIPNSLVRTEPS